METGYSRRGTAPLLLCSIALLHLGWLKFFGYGEAVYIMDWVVRLAVLAVAWQAIKSGMPPWYPELPLRAWILWLVLAYLATGCIGIGKDLILALLNTGDLRLQQYPRLEIGLVWAVDMTAGLLLVALTEEAVYRKTFADLWRERQWPVWSLYLASPAAFGLLHINQGLGQFISTYLWGLFFLWAYRRTGNLPLVVLIHWLVNLWFFNDHLLPYYTLQSDFLCNLAPKCIQAEAFATWPEEFKN